MKCHPSGVRQSAGCYDGKVVGRGGHGALGAMGLLGPMGSWAHGAQEGGTSIHTHNPQHTGGEGEHPPSVPGGDPSRSQGERGSKTPGHIYIVYV